MFKSFVKLLCATALTSAVLAQEIFIALPKENATVTAGSELTVQLDKPRSLSGSAEVAVVIGIERCAQQGCPDVTEVLGEVLYNGPFDPQPHTDSSYYPYQNFTVIVPGLYNGVVQLGVAHVFLLGAGSTAELRLISTTINVVAPN